MANSYNLSDNYALDLISAEYLQDPVAASDPLLKLLPMQFKDTAKVKWDQPENGYGLLSARGLNSKPDITGVAGFKEYSMDPGYYGEQTIIDEKQMTVQREPGTIADPIEMDYLISNSVKQLTRRLLDRVRYIIGLLFYSGKFFVQNNEGSVVHTDAIENFNLLTPSTPWSSASSAVPIDDMLGWQYTLQTGTSSVFDESTTILMSDLTINDLLATTQIRNVFKLQYGSSPLGLKGMNDILNGFGLPSIQRYNEGYYPTQADGIAHTNFTRFLPYKKIIWAGKRPEGVPIGNFLLTRNMINKAPVGGAPDLSYDNSNAKGGLAEGIYTLLKYVHEVPVRMELDIGFNGGPAVRYPSSIAGIYY